MLGVVAKNGAGTIVGVVNDFHVASLTEKVAPIILFNDPSYAGGFLVRAGGSQMPDVLKAIDDKWKATITNRPFNYSFLDEQYNSLYLAQMRSGTLITIFAIISIGIACFGLLGLSSFTAIQRAREIGVRKVLGATTGNIVLLLSHDYLRLLAVSCVLAVPASYMLMQRWLQQFAYHIDLSPTYFAGGIAAVLFIAWATVGYHSVKASVANPVDSLKYE
jgi:putative ABC transport system permease protein